ncbi:MAG: RNA polymerase sigma factor [Planctomycetota bacterium]
MNDQKPSQPEMLDRDAFAALIHEHTPTLRLVARAAAGPAHADDVIQNACVTALGMLHRFTPGTDFRAWMVTVIRNTAKNTIRSERRRSKRDLAVGQRNAASDSALQANPTTDFSDFDENVRNAIDSLGPLPRECLLLKVVQDLSYREIAAVVGIPEATARSHVHRAKAQLAKQLQEDQAGQDTTSPQERGRP